MERQPGVPPGRRAGRSKSSLTARWMHCSRALRQPCPRGPDTATDDQIHPQERVINHTRFTRGAFLVVSLRAEAAIFTISQGLRPRKLEACGGGGEARPGAPPALGVSRRPAHARRTRMSMSPTYGRAASTQSQTRNDRFRFEAQVKSLGQLS